MEKYKEIIGFENYSVSNIGNVKSNNIDKILSPELLKSGYHRVKLFKNGKSKKILIHRLVAEHFLDNPENKPFVNHKNGIKTDNRLINLEFVSAKENTSHAFNIGLMKNEKGEKCNRSILNSNDVLRIRKLKDENKHTFKYIANIYNVSIGCIKQIVYRKTWNHI